METQTFVDNFSIVADAPDGPQRLRDLVLDLAARGRLVAQDPGEAPASQLLEQIEAAREVRISRGEVSRQRPRSRPSRQCPHGWESVDLGTVVDLEYGRPLPARSREESGSVPVYGSNGIVGWHDQPLVTSQCLVVGRKGSAGAVTVSTGPCWPIDTTYFVRPLAGMGTRFVAILLQASRLRELDRATAVPGLNREQAYQVLVLLPPLAEQERIVAKVDELLGHCDALEALQQRRRRATTQFRGSALNTLTESETPEDLRHAWERVSITWPILIDHPESVDILRQVILRLAVQGKLARQDANDLPAQDLLAHIAEQQSDLRDQKALRGVRMPALAPWLPAPALPSTWAWTTLGSVLRHCRNGSSATPNDQGVGYPILRISAGTSDSNGVVDLDDHKFTALDEVEALPYMLESGDLLACRFNGNLRFVGRVAMVPSRQGTFLHPDKLIRLMAISVDHGFLAIALNSTGTRQQIEGAASTTAGNIGINGTQFQALHIPLPPLPEQRRIAEKVGLLLGLCTQLERRMSSRDGLADRTVTTLVRSLSGTA